MLNKRSFVIIAGISIIVMIGVVFAIQTSQKLTVEIESENSDQTEIKIAGEDELEADPSLPTTEKDIEDKLNQIELKKENNTYNPAPREWISSGPFQIDRTKYLLGEKVFITAGALSSNEKGQVVFLRPLNETHYSVYLTIPFDGASKNAFNYYFEPRLSLGNKICTTDQLVGKWAVVFRGTDYPNLYFDVVDQIIPGSQSTFQPKC